MKIAFIFPIVADTHSRNKPIRVQTSICLGISYISSVLKLRGHLTRLFVLTPNNGEQIETSLNIFNPQLICFTAVSTTYYLVKNFASIYKQSHPHIFLIAGGCHVSLNPEKAITDPFDAICIGEGEYPVLELADMLEQGLNPSRIQNLWIKNGSDIEKNTTRPFIDKLDELPFPDRQMWKEWLQYPKTLPAILISRGCPFRCTYCCHHKLADLAPGRYFRFRSPQNILDEIKDYLITYPKTKEIYFETETIFNSLEYVQQLCSALQQFNNEHKWPLAFSANIRLIHNADYEILFEALHQGNFKYVNIGLESGSEGIRREILDRDYSNDEIIGAVRLARKYGLKVRLFIMMGLPGETPADFEQTIDVTRKCQPDKYILSIFYPYPGTELARLCVENGLIDRRVNFQSVNERKQPVLKLLDFPPKQVTRAYIRFEYNVFKGYKPLHEILIRVLERKAITSPLLGRFYYFLLGIPIIFHLKNKLVRLINLV